MDCACLVNKICAYYYYKKGVYAPDRQLDDIFEGGKTVPHENTYIRKTNQIKTLEITEI